MQLAGVAVCEVSVESLARLQPRPDVFFFFLFFDSSVSQPTEKQSKMFPRVRTQNFSRKVRQFIKLHRSLSHSHCLPQVRRREQSMMGNLGG